IRAEIVGEIEFGRRSRLHTYFRAVEVERGFLVHGPANEESLAIVIVSSRKVQPKFDLTRHCPRSVAREDINAARSKRVKSTISVERCVIDLARVIKNRGRNGTAQFDIKAAPVAVLVAGREAIKSFADAAIQCAAILYRLEHLCIRRCGNTNRCE